MTIVVIQALPGDPRFKEIDNHIMVHFGRVVFNWKPNSVNKLMRFFLAKSPSKPSNEIMESIKSKSKLRESVGDEIEIASVGSMTHLDEVVLPDRISLKL